MDELQDIRTAIDDLDDEIIRLLGERFIKVRQAGLLKTKHGLKIEQTDRVEEVLNRTALISEKHNLAPEFVRALYELVIKQAHHIEHDIAGRLP